MFARPDDAYGCDMQIGLKAISGLSVYPAVMLSSLTYTKVGTSLKVKQPLNTTTHQTLYALFKAFGVPTERGPSTLKLPRQ